MMAQTKRKYKVYSKYYFATDYPEHWGTNVPDSGYMAGDWKLEGETWAVSESKAINNVRFRTRGEKSSQYYPDYDSGRTMEGYYWKAVAV